MAGGITLRRERLDAFRDAFNRACAAQVAPGELVPSQRVDAVVSVRDLTLELERALHWLEPTGMGNPGPVFGLENLRLESAPRPVGEDHVRLLLADGAGRLPVIAFNVRQEVERVVAGSGGRFRAAIRLQRDRWQGRDEVEGRLVAFEAA